MRDLGEFPSSPKARLSFITDTLGAETLLRTLKPEEPAELIRNKGAWKGIDDVELAAAERVHWFNTYRPHRSTWCSDSLCVPIRLFQCAAAGCVARARADGDEP